MMECQLLQHIDTQIIETIQKLEELEGIDTTKEVTHIIIMRRNILDFIPNADSVNIFQEFSQLGFLFTFNILKEPVICFSSEIVSSHLALLSVADTILMAFSSGILVTCDSLDSKDMINDVCNLVCNMGSLGDDNYPKWMSQSVSKAIVTAIHSIDHFIRCIYSIVTTNHVQIESSSMMSENVQSLQFARSQAKYVLNELASRCRTIMSERELSGSKNVVISSQRTNAGTIEKVTQKKITLACSPILKMLSFCKDTHFGSLPRSKSQSIKQLLRRLKQIHSDPTKSPLMRLMIESRIISTYCECNIIILDVDKNMILRISTPECNKTLKMIYDPPSREYPNGHFKKYINGEVAEFTREKINLFNLNNDVDYCLFQAVNSST